MAAFQHYDLILQYTVIQDCYETHGVTHMVIQ